MSHYLEGDAKNTWRRSALDGGAPYTVWKAPSMPWWTVCDRNGTNVITNGTGAVFTSEEEATRLKNEWNAERVSL